MKTKFLIPLTMIATSLLIGGCASVKDAYRSASDTVSGWVKPSEQKPVEIKPVAKKPEAIKPQEAKPEVKTEDVKPPEVKN